MGGILNKTCAYVCLFLSLGESVGAFVPSSIPGIVPSTVSLQPECWKNRNLSVFTAEDWKFFSIEILDWERVARSTSFLEDKKHEFYFVDGNLEEFYSAYRSPSKMECALSVDLSRQFFDVLISYFDSPLRLQHVEVGYWHVRLQLNNDIDIFCTHSPHWLPLRAEFTLGAIQKVFGRSIEIQFRNPHL